MLWAGLADSTDQLTAMKSFRRDMNDALGKIIEPLNKLTMHLNNREPKNHINFDFMLEELTNLLKSSKNTNIILEPLIGSFIKFTEETKLLVKALENNSITEIKSIIKQSQILFKGTGGLGMNFYIGYKD